MIIEVTVKDEDRHVDAFRQHLRAEARRVVADHPDRPGKRYAQVEFPWRVEFRSLYIDGAAEQLKLKVEFV